MTYSAWDLRNKDAHENITIADLIQLVHKVTMANIELLIDSKWVPFHDAIDDFEWNEDETVEENFLRWDKENSK